MPDNWVTILSLAVAALAIIIPYFSNLLNIKARRIEIVTEKSIEAYRELIQKIKVVEHLFYRRTHEKFIPFEIEIRKYKEIGALEFEHEQGYSSKVVRVAMAINECYEVFESNRIYFPGVLAKDIEALLYRWSELGDPREKQMASDEIWKELGLIKQTEELIKRIQIYIGVNTKEKHGWKATITRWLKR